MNERRTSISLAGIDLLSFLGPQDAHLRRLEDAFPGRLVIRGDEIELVGAPVEVEKMESALRRMVEWARAGRTLDPSAIERFVAGEAAAAKEVARTSVELGGTERESVQPRTPGQSHYLETIRSHEIVFAIGPAGTGKTYLAVVMAVRALLRREVDRIILVRPAVEAGEQLGFLPGDLQEKIDPYLRPLYDALTDMLGSARVARLIAAGTIEVAPLAYMRGRTLNRAFVILDEGQNTTLTQMKMFLTRIGEGTRAVVTGDVTQIDLQDPGQSGLIRVQEILAEVPGIAFVRLLDRDVVRHPLVRAIVEAFDGQRVRSARAEREDAALDLIAPAGGAAKSMPEAPGSVS
jgi:phosphate starvation-inducible protein PhoH and related proteins